MEKKELLLKRIFKRKVSFSLAILVVFCMTGVVGFAADTDPATVGYVNGKIGDLKEIMENEYTSDTTIVKAIITADQKLNEQLNQRIDDEVAARKEAIGNLEDVMGNKYVLNATVTDAIISAADDVTMYAAEKVNTEKEEREAADKELDKKINDEVTAREVSISALDGKISDEASARETADKELDGKIKANTAKIEKNARDINELRTAHNRGMAQMAAMASVDFGNVKARTIKVGAAVGNHRGESAIAVGVAVAPTDQMLVNAKWSTPASTTKGSTFGLGATYEFNF